MSRNLGALTCWNPVGLFRPVMGQLFLNYFLSNRFTAAGQCHKNTELDHCFIYLQEFAPNGRNRNRTVPTIPQYRTFCHGRETALFIDKMSRFFFPFSFFILNVVYWSTFL
jgi:hypothetical protein